MKFLSSLPLIALLSLSLNACAGGAGSTTSTSQSNDGGSSPINGKEELAYKRAINKCYKTGGSRVVKVEGQLMCY
ncbi:MAG: hypothetical protein EOP10_22770 [Proteobacteria bacterium]|nr:MAG: hypothetical protein EOP10_22770 [Pseudomonadota bacterium]